MKIPVPGCCASDANNKRLIGNREREFASSIRVSQGFTLVEVIIVVAIMSVLISIALPAYQGYVLRSHRTTVQSEMLKILTRQEIYYVENRQYGTLEDLRYNANIVGINNNGDIVAAGNGIYDLQMDTGQPANEFLIEADATGTQVADKECLEMTLDSTGSREAIECW